MYLPGNVILRHRVSKQSYFVGNMAMTVGLGANSGVLRILEEESETLKDLLSDFSARIRESNILLFLLL